MRVCDSETNELAFEATRMWINVSYDFVKNLWGISFDPEVYLMEDWSGEVRKSVNNAPFIIYPSHLEHFKLLEKGGVCYHSYFQFDRLIIRKLIKSDWNPVSEDDTYILSQLYHPDRGLHSIDAWAKRLDDVKPAWDKWGEWDVAMIDRCISDTRIGTKVWYALEEERKAWEDVGESWEESTKIEYGIARLQGEQEYHGVKLDVEKAYDLADEIYQEIQAIDETLLSSMPMRVLQGSEVATPFRKDGKLQKRVEDWFNV